MHRLCKKRLFTKRFRQVGSASATCREHASNRSEVRPQPVARKGEAWLKLHFREPQTDLTTFHISFDCKHFATLLSAKLLTASGSDKCIQPRPRSQTSHLQRLWQAKCQNVNSASESGKTNFFRALNIFNHVFKYEYENIFLILHRVSEKGNAKKSENLYRKLFLNIINP